MENQLMAAISKLAKFEEIPVGKFVVDEIVTLKVNANVQKLEDHQYTPTNSVPLKAVIGILLAKMGFQRERAMAILVEAITQALLEEKSADSALRDRISDVDLAMSRVQSVLEALPKQTRKGALKVEGKIEHLLS